MNLDFPLLRWAVAGVLAFAATAIVGRRWQEKLTVYPEGGVRVYAQDSGEGGLQGRDATQKVRKTDAAYVAEYGFRNFNSDALDVRYEVPRAQYEAWDAEWGYKDEDIAALKTWLDSARKQALADAVKKHHNQQQLNDAVAMLKKQHDQKLHDYLASKGFRMLSDGTVDVDMPALVRKHAARVAALAKVFDDISTSKKYQSGDTIGAVTAMVQTAVLYKVPPNVVNGVHTGGLWPPEKTLINGWGDCDTKTGLLASILRNWPAIKVIGLSLPDHYIMGLQRVPLKGDLFVEFEGQQYVLVEPAGPAWLSPGLISEGSQHLLESKEGYKVDVLF